MHAPIYYIQVQGQLGIEKTLLILISVFSALTLVIEPVLLSGVFFFFFFTFHLILSNQELYHVLSVAKIILYCNNGI